MIAFLLAGCGEQGSSKDSSIDSSADTPSVTQDSVALESAANTIVAFLRGQTPLPDSLIADSVALYVAPEGGGGRTSYSRSQLAEPTNWQVVFGGRRVSVAPPAASTKLTSKTGRHYNCRETTLASRYAELARLPHVGTKLEPENAASCLQSWNLTLVFDSIRNPRLIAAVYDQWEW